MFKRTFVNNQIRAAQVRVIDEAGQQLGVMALEEALRISRERNLDLIQVTEKAEPPVCRIMDYGKYQYSLQKKERKVRIKKSGEIKEIRLGFNISLHDMEVRANSAEKFLNKGHRVKIAMVLRGREKALSNFAKGKMNQFLEVLGKKVPIKIERELKKEARGFTMIIAKA